MLSSLSCYNDRNLANEHPPSRFAAPADKSGESRFAVRRTSALRYGWRGEAGF